MLETERTTSRRAVLFPFLSVSFCFFPFLSVNAMGRKPAVGSQEKKTMEWTGAFGNVGVAGSRVARTASEWEALWQDIGSPAPAADLSSYYAVAAFAGQKPTGGYSLAFDPPASSGGKTVVVCRVRPPSGMAIQAFTRPYAVKLFPKTSLPVEAQIAQ